MGTYLERQKREVKDNARDLREARETAREIAEAKEATRRYLDEIDSIDDDVLDALDRACEAARADASRDFSSRAEAPLKRAASKAESTGRELQKGIDEAQTNKSKLDGVDSPYGQEGIRAARNKVEQTGREYEQTKVDLERATSEAEDDIEKRRREVDS